MSKIDYSTLSAESLKSPERPGPLKGCQYTELCGSNFRGSFNFQSTLLCFSIDLSSIAHDSRNILHCRSLSHQWVVHLFTQKKKMKRASPGKRLLFHLNLSGCYFSAIVRMPIQRCLYICKIAFRHLKYAVLREYRYSAPGNI